MDGIVSKRHLNEIPFGSFFGPSVLPRRVKQDIKNSLENPKYGVQQPENIKASTLVDKIRDSRDYSFLFSDDPKSSVPSKKGVLDGSCTKNLAGISAGSKNRVMGQESSKILKKVRSQAADTTKNASRTAKGKFGKERSLTKDVVKSVPSRVEGSKKPRDLEKPQKIREYGESVKGNSQSRTLAQAKVGKRKTGTTEDAIAFAMIRKMFPRYDPNKFRDDKDDIMQSSLADIEKEERQSTKWAKKEDEEELQKLIKSKRSKSGL